MGGVGGGGADGLGKVQNIPGREKFGGLAFKKIPASCIDLQVYNLPQFRNGAKNV